MDLQGPFLNDAWDAAIRQCVDETRTQFEAGRAVCDGVTGRLRYELRATWLGGMRILERVERTGAALLSRRPAIGARDVPVLLWRAARWPSRS
jgi:phytoene/squalene synthetase